MKRNKALKFKVLTSIPKILNKKTAVAIGVFDGVHIGHKKIILTALKSGLFPVVLTFNFRNSRPDSKKNFSFINTNRQKFKLIGKLGFCMIVSLNFEDIKNLGFVEFFENVLVKNLNAKLIVCGSNLKFGKNREGNAFILKKMAKKKSIIVKIENLIKINGLAVSSSRARKALKEGNLLLYRKFTGRFFNIEFIANKVEKFGDLLVFHHKIKDFYSFLKDGCYFSIIKLKEKFYLAKAYVATVCGVYFVKAKMRLNLPKKDIENSCVSLFFIKKI